MVLPLNRSLNGRQLVSSAARIPASPRSTPKCQSAVDPLFAVQRFGHRSGKRTQAKERVAPIVERCFPLFLPRRKLSVGEVSFQSGGLAEEVTIDETRKTAFKKQDHAEGRFVLVNFVKPLTDG